MVANKYHILSNNFTINNYNFSYNFFMNGDLDIKDFKILISSLSEGCISFYYITIKIIYFKIIIFSIYLAISCVYLPIPVKGDNKDMPSINSFCFKHTS